MRRFLTGFAVLLFASSSIYAKLQVKIDVDISNEKLKREMQEGIEARINSTERYTITSNAIETDLVLAVDCLVIETGAFVCDSTVTYFPYKNSALSTSVETAGVMAKASADNSLYVVNSLMNHFINGTTDALLADRKNTLRRAIRSLCEDVPTECKKPQR